MQLFVKQNAFEPLINYFCKKLHRRYFTGFWIGLRNQIYRKKSDKELRIKKETAADKTSITLSARYSIC